MSDVQVATFAGGCFWCTEAVFRRVKGVTAVRPGYTGGTIPHPTYEQVSAGNTGHTEAVEIQFSPQHVSFNTLLSIFWQIHDPTTRDRQGADIGPQYRSAIFYHTEEQREIAEQSKRAEAQRLGRTIVTEITAAGEFYPAEDYHRDYYEKNSYAPYCQVVIDPKITKLLTAFPATVKQEYRK